MPPLQLPSRGDPRSSSGARLGKGGAGSGGADFSPLGGGGGYAVKRKDNLFLWTVFILLLTGLVMACWVGSYYVYVHPEKPRNYRILTKLKKLLPPQRFSINAAPTGEFITADKLHAKLVAMTPPEFRDNNNDLFRAYLRNYPPGRVTVPYLTGRFNVIESYTLGPTDLATSGVVALAASEDSPKVLIEHLFTAPVNLVPLIKRNLPMGKDLELPRTYYLTAVIHAEKLPDGRMLLTVVPLNYGSYGIKGSPSAFSLEPPNSLDLSGGLPIIKEPQREEAMRAYLAYRQKNGLNPLFGSRRQRPAGSENTSSSAPLTGTDKPPPPPDNESAIERTPPTDTVASATPTPAGRAGNNNRGSRPSTTPAPAPTPSAEPSPSQQRVARALPVNSPGGLAASPSPRQTPSPAPASSPRPTAAVAASASPSPRPAGSTSGGRGSWTVYPPGRAPAGRQVKINEIAGLGDNTTQTASGQPLYLSGRFSVSVIMNNPETGEGGAVLYPSGDRSVRIIAKYPPGRTLPAEGAQIDRDEQRPYQITDVRRGADGLLNVWVREITAE